MRRLLVFSSIFITLMTSVAYANFYSKPVPIDFQSQPAKQTPPSQNQSTPAVQLKNPQDDNTLTVDADDFFQQLELCSGQLKMESPNLSGKLYGEKNNICHYTLTIKPSDPSQKKITYICYVPMEQLLLAYSQIPTTNDGDQTTDKTQSLNVLPPAAGRYFSAMPELVKYCTEEGALKKYDQLKATFQGNTKATQ